MSERKLKRLDALFGETPQPVSGEQVVMIDDTLIDEFPGHPYKLYTGKRYTDLLESIQELGVITPVILRREENGRYTLLAGYNRRRCNQVAGNKQIPAVVRQGISDGEAKLIITHSNRQRGLDELLPSEKAFAYKMKLDAMKRQAGRPSKENLSQVGTQKRSDQLLADQVGQSRNQIQRYIRLTELIPSVLQMVDDGKIAFRPAVELSYLSKEQQESLYSTMECEDCTPSLAQAIKMKEFSKDGKLTDVVILSIMQEEKPNQKEQFKMPKERISKYFAPGTPAQKIEDTIIKALEMYRKRQRDMER